MNSFQRTGDIITMWITSEYGILIDSLQIDLTEYPEMTEEEAKEKLLSEVQNINSI